MRRFWRDSAVLFVREVLRYRRERAYWAGQILFPLAFVGFVGFGLDRVTQLPGGTSYVGYLASGMLALTVGSGAVGAGFSLIEERKTTVVRFARILLGHVPAFGETRAATKPRRCDQPLGRCLILVPTLLLQKRLRRVNLFGPSHVANLVYQLRDFHRRTFRRRGSAGQAQNYRCHEREARDFL